MKRTLAALGITLAAAIFALGLFILPNPAAAQVTSPLTVEMEAIGFAEGVFLALKITNNTDSQVELANINASQAAVISPGFVIELDPVIGQPYIHPPTGTYFINAGEIIAFTYSETTPPGVAIPAGNYIATANVGYSTVDGQGYGAIASTIVRVLDRKGN